MTPNDHRCELTGRGVGARLRTLRLQAGLAQAQIAVRLGTTQPTIARLERDRNRVSLESVGRVAATLGCKSALVIELRQST